MKQFVLFFLSIFLLTVGARSQEAYQKKYSSPPGEIR